jgi:hypothetical protein
MNRTDNQKSQIDKGNNGFSAGKDGSDKSRSEKSHSKESEETKARPNDQDPQPDQSGSVPNDSIQQAQKGPRPDVSHAYADTLGDGPKEP